MEHGVSDRVRAQVSKIGRVAPMPTRVAEPIRRPWHARPLLGVDVRAVDLVVRRENRRGLAQSLRLLDAERAAVAADP